MKKTMMKVAISLFLATVLLVSMTGVVSANGVQTWYLTKDKVGTATDIYYMNQTAPSGSAAISIQEGSCALWVANDSATVDLTFPAATWSVVLYGNSNSSNKGNCTVYVGKWASDGMANFTAYGSVSGIVVPKDYTTFDIPASAFDIKAGEYLALMICNTATSGGALVIKEGESSISYPEGDPTYPAPEVSTAILLGLGLVGLLAYVGARRYKVFA